MAGFSMYRVQERLLRVRRVMWAHPSKPKWPRNRDRQTLLTMYAGAGTLSEMWHSLPNTDDLFVYDEDG